MKIEDDINHELGRLPPTLADLYAVIYEQAVQTGFKSRLIAEGALKWLLCAQENLSTEKIHRSSVCGLRNIYAIDKGEYLRALLQLRHFRYRT